MTTQQTDEAATRVWADGVVECLARHIDFWEVWCNFDAQAPRYGIALVPWDSEEPDPAPLEWQPCAGYEEAAERATALNEQRLGRGGRA